MSWFRRVGLAYAALGVSVAGAQLPYFENVGKLEAAVPVANGSFGSRLVAHGDWAAIGEPYAKDEAGQPTPRVHMVALAHGTATPADILYAPEPPGNEGFGTTLAISGDTLVVGNDDVACSRGSSCGAVYVFVLREGRWVFDARIDSPVPARNDRFGQATALDGDTLVVQSRGDRPGVVRRAGVLDVFVREDGVFHHEQTLQPAGIAASARFGEAIALSGDTLLAGAASDLVANVARGAVYVMQRGAAGFVQEARLVDETQTRFGTMLTIHDDLWFVVTPRDTGSFAGQGSLRTYRRRDGVIRELPKLVDPLPGPDNDFGTSIAVQGDRLWIGSEETTPDRYDYGAMKAFALADGQATFLGALRAPAGAPEDGFAARAAAAGRYLLIGAPEDSVHAEHAGAVHVYYDARSAVGGACSEDAGCSSGHCIDGMCCARDCDTSGGCTACRGALTGESDGTCAPVLAGTACGSDASEACSAPDTCDGAGACLANHLANGTACEDGLFCTAGDACDAGQCIPGLTSSCDADQVCVEAEATCRSQCGDGVLQRDETCDDGTANSDTTPDACRTDCQQASCGDGVVDRGEACDEGVPSDTCSATCMLLGCRGTACDAGAGETDAGTGETDAGAPDAGAGETDAGLPEQDAGTIPERDGNPDASDPGSEPDAGTTPSAPGGCSVGARPSPAWLAPLSLFFAVLVRRRRLRRGA